jgi:hypothetical protein
MMLHAIDTRGWEKATAWCVPSSVSFLTGIPLIHSHSRAAFIQDKALKDVDGVFASEALLLLREQGYKGEQIKLLERYSDAPTLRKFLKDRTPYEMCMPLMIQIEDKKDFCHMVTSHYGYAADNHTMKPVAIDKFPHLRKYVTGAWIVSKL